MKTTENLYSVWLKTATLKCASLMFAFIRTICLGFFFIDSLASTILPSNTVFFSLRAWLAFIHFSKMPINFLSEFLAKEKKTKKTLRWLIFVVPLTTIAWSCSLITLFKWLVVHAIHLNEDEQNFHSNWIFRKMCFCVCVAAPLANSQFTYCCCEWYFCFASNTKKSKKKHRKREREIDSRSWCLLVNLPFV